MPAGISLLKINNRNTRTYFTPCSSVSNFKFENVIASWVLCDIRNNTLTSLANSGNEVALNLDLLFVILHVKLNEFELFYHC